MPPTYDSLSQDEPETLSESNASDTLTSSPLQHLSLADLMASSTSAASAGHADTMGARVARSREGSIPLRHPTPDLQSLQGAYLGNVERLEQSAERMSLSSDIGEEIRKMKIEQRQSESRRSSMQKSRLEHRSSAASLHHQDSNGHGSHASNSIVRTNSIARVGGFSPAGYVPSPRGSLYSGSRSNQNSVKGRTASQGSRLTQLTEPKLEGKPLDFVEEDECYMSTNPTNPEERRPLQMTNGGPMNLDDIEIPHTASIGPSEEAGEVSKFEPDRASMDTYRQGDALFSDFDGTHTMPHPTQHSPPSPEPSLDHRRSSQVPPVEHTPVANMVYYPAPVPMMLNLPKRLSKMPAMPAADKRRSELMKTLSPEAQKSAPWLPDLGDAVEEEPSSGQYETSGADEVSKHQSTVNLPPQLRASMFFDYPSRQHDVQIKGESAVATLDSILDASAFAPVSAFTDHPIAGRVGPEVYGRGRSQLMNPITPDDILEKKKRKSSIMKLQKRDSGGDLLNVGKKRNSSLLSLGNFGKRKSSGQHFDDAVDRPGPQLSDDVDANTPMQQQDSNSQTEHSQYEDEEEEGEQIPNDSEEREEDDFTGAPTTLLAELQMRKAEQKKRTRAAATAFPDGMHSTLLQLDAVAQIQQQSRNQKHTTLAWEDPTTAPGAGEDDEEDVPLAMLRTGRNLDVFEKSRRFDEDRPLGLLAQREMEDNEPLSHRRARLHGEDPRRNQGSAQSNLMYSQAKSDFQLDDGKKKDGQDEDEPQETLAERMRRLKATQIPSNARDVSGDFASEMLSQLGGVAPAEGISHHTIAQESRLPFPGSRATGNNRAEETLAQRKKRLQAASAARMNSGGGVGQYANGSHPQHGPSRVSLPMPSRVTDGLPARDVAGMRRVSNEMTYIPATQARSTAWTSQVHRQAGMDGTAMATYVDGRFAVGTGQIPGSAPGVDAGQMDMVDRWRQSVV